MRKFPTVAQLRIVVALCVLIAGVIVVAQITQHRERSQPTPPPVAAANAPASNTAPQTAKLPLSPVLPEGTHAWNFTTYTLSGRKLTLKSLRGHPVVVDFWATWCPPCRASIPGLEKIYEEYRRYGVHVVGISMDTDTARQVAPFARSAHMNYTVALDPPDNITTYQHYDLAGPIPCLFVLDKEGVVRWSTYGNYEDVDHHIKATLNKILAGS